MAWHGAEGITRAYRSRTCTVRGETKNVKQRDAAHRAGGYWTKAEAFCDNGWDKHPKQLRPELHGEK